MESFWQIFDRVVDASSEEEVINIFITSVDSFSCIAARYYDVHYFPFRNQNFFVLRESSENNSIPNGYIIENSTIDKNDLATGLPKYENSRMASVKKSQEKMTWVKDLNLDGHGWIDIPLLTGGFVYGLWALTIEGLRDISSNEIEKLKRIATLSCFKISQLRKSIKKGW